ncbi:MAG: 50S ribosomal protein L16 [Planctomycetes bacterium RBG_16_43_13]|nr:MAG: 50S ribosomal protein L16 [Planctomycetes bacterium RBG_16_43_13]
MKLMPKRVKFRKTQRGKMKGVATRCNKVSFGDYGLMSLENAWIDAKQLEAGRVVASHFMGTEGRLYIRVFPHKSVTAKPAETRMGSGKGEPEYYAAVVRPGTVMFELSGVTEGFARECLNLIAHKMPIATKMVSRRQL